MAGPIPRTAVAKKIIKHRINYNGSKQYKVLWEYYPDKPEGYVSFEAKKNMLDWGKANSLIRKYDFEVANKSAIEARKGDIKMFKRRHFKDSANPNHSCHRMKTRNDARNEIESSDSHTSSSSNIPTDSQTSYHSPNVWVQDSDAENSEVSSQDSIVTLVPVENQSPFDMLASAVTMDMTRKTLGNGRHSLPSTPMSSSRANSLHSLRRYCTIN